MNPTDTARALAAYLDDVTRLRRPFDWGSHNCCHFAAGWVARVEGEHPMTGLATTPDASAAWRLLKTMGGGLQAAWTQRLGRQPVAVRLAQLGDLVLLALPPASGDHALLGRRQTMGVCCGRTVACLDDAGTSVHLPIDRGVCAWRVGVAA